MAIPLASHSHLLAHPHLLAPPLPHEKQRWTTNSNLIKTHPSLLLIESCRDMTQLKQIHAQMLRNGIFHDPFFASRLVAFCSISPNGNLNYADLLLTQIHNPTIFTYNTIIKGYMIKDLYSKAFSIYQKIFEDGFLPDNFTFPSVLKACQDLNEGKMLHCHVFKLGFQEDIYVQNAQINMYANCDGLESARKVFDKMIDKNVVSWTTMIASYAKMDMSEEALDLFRQMGSTNASPNEVTLVNVLMACTKSGDLELGKQIHEYIERNGIELNFILATALIDLYAKNGCIDLARKIFNEMNERSIVSWNAMINGYIRDSDYKEALLLFRDMQVSNVKPDEVTMVSLLIACTHLGAIEIGKWVHLYIEKEKIEVDVFLGTALVDFYAKCGCIDSAWSVFKGMAKQDVLTWTSMIGGFSMCGRGQNAIELFEEMQKTGLKPDAITFVGVLTACSHGGLVEEGRQYFDSMMRLYEIEPKVEHYSCMVDILGRAGHLVEAEELVRNMPMKPDAFVLGSLLSACRIHSNLEIAQRAAQRLLELDPSNGGAYVLLSNVYGALGKWNDANRVRNTMLEKSIKKPPGCSLIEVNGTVHEFVVGDISHPRCTEIYAMLDDMIGRLKLEGYVPNTSQVLFEMDEEEKEDAVSRHSEKLAIAFGLISTAPGVTVRIVKNLRVCGDCHSATKLISKVYDREIIVRDRNRFHHFKGGSCSCMNFW
ncbi:hypothetical protein AMTRI_Chr05g63930 [Amborella trichopoda]